MEELEINVIRRTVVLDDETDSLVEAVSQERKYRNYSLAVRTIIREWYTLKSNPAIAAEHARQFPVAAAGPRERLLTPAVG